METSLEHEDMLIKLRGQLNEGKIKLWEPPYISSDGSITADLQALANKLSVELSIDYDATLQGLCELQQHSIERSQANDRYKATGLATFRVKAVSVRRKPIQMNIQKKLSETGKDLIDAIADELGEHVSRIKVIFNGKVLKPEDTLEDQGLKNGVQLMTLLMTDSPEEAQKEDKMYMEMKATRDDATIISEYTEDLTDDEQVVKIEDQSGYAVELPAAEKRSLLVGMALHERGRAAIKDKEYALALVLLLEADRQLDECRSAILSSVDNSAVLQLDIAWCYLCLKSLPSAQDAAERLQRAQKSFRASYGEDNQRLIALKGTAANERVLLMRLYLLQGIVAFHQNKRAEAKRLLDQAEHEMNFLRVDEGAVSALLELGWSRGQARAGLRAAAGRPDAAHHYLDRRTRERKQARNSYRAERLKRALGVCTDGQAVRAGLVDELVASGHARRLAILALRATNNNLPAAESLILHNAHTLTGEVSDDADTPEEVQPDEQLIAQMESMGYAGEQARGALRRARNDLSAALDLITRGLHTETNAADPSTSSGMSESKIKTKSKSERRKERRLALERLTSSIKGDEEDHLDTSLADEEQFLAQYKSLL